MLGHHAIILTDASVAFLPECVSCDFAKSKCRSLGAMKGTTPRKMIPLCMVSVSLCCSNTFSAPEHCFQLALLIRFVMSWSSLFVPISVWFLHGSPNHSERSRCYWLRSKIDRCRIRLRQNPFGSKHLRGVSALLACTSTHSWNPLELLPILWF